MSEARRTETLELLAGYRISAILRTHDAERADRAMAAAVEGGFRAIEFTLNTPGALDLIRRYSARAELLVGAGTVLTPDDARDAVEAGARFIVSPVMDPEVIRAGRELGAVTVPGTSTPTEMLAAHRAGADLVKVFPAAADPVGMVGQVLGPLPFLRLFPTAGVTPENFREILAAGAFGVGFVNSLFDAGEIARGDYAAIRERSGKILAALGVAVA